jgi:hypothetical protein
MPPTDDWVVEQVLTISGTLVATLLCWLLAEYAQSRPRVRQAGRILGIVVLTGLCALGIMRCHSLFSGRNATAASMGRAESTTSASPPQTATVPQPARLPAQVVQAPGPQAPTPPPSPNARQRAPWRAWFPGGTPPKEPLVFVVDAGGTYDATVSDAVARPMGGVAGGLTPAFLTSGAFHRLVEGESREIEAAIGACPTCSSGGVERPMRRRKARRQGCCA